MSLLGVNACLEFTKFIYEGQNPNIENAILEIDPLNGTRTVHKITKRPQCPVCGDPSIMTRPPQPITINPQTRKSDDAGGYRTVSPEETLAKYEHHVSPLTGIVPYLKPYQTGKAPLIHNYSSGRNIALQSKSMFWLNMHLRSGNGGKGKTELQAKVGALCEAIERYCIMYHGETYTIKGSLESLPEAIHPNACMNYSDEQLAHRDIANQDATKFYALVPIPFDEKEEMEWTPVYSLTQEKFKYLPACYCYAQYPCEDEMRMYSYPDSNGCASGNTLEEAILQGFLELVERDGAAIWWYNRLQRPQVDLASAQNDYIDKVVAYYEEIGRELYVLDLTTDLGIPVFASISYRKDPAVKDEVLYAFGAHVEAGIALERAIIEMNQLLPLAEITDGKYLIDDPVFVRWLQFIRVEDHAWLRPAPVPSRNIQTDYPPLCPPTIHGAIHCCVDAAREVGLETLVLDMTQPDVGMPVAKVMVPGLRHMWKRLAPGRLYDVPVKMGWLEKALEEEELNPIGIFI